MNINLKTFKELDKIVTPLAQHPVKNSHQTILFGHQDVFFKGPVQFGCGKALEFGRKHLLNQVFHLFQLGAQVTEAVDVHQFLLYNFLRGADQV